jgi:hypothetical protein
MVKVAISGAKIITHEPDPYSKEVLLLRWNFISLLLIGIKTNIEICEPSNKYSSLVFHFVSHIY